MSKKKQSIFSLLFSLAFKELWGYRRITIFIVLNLTISLTAFILVNSFKNSLAAYVEKNSRSILTADISIYSRRPFTEQEKSLIATLPQQNVATRYSYFSMVKNTDRNAQLVTISVISDNYPLYGNIVLEDFEGNPVDFAQAHKELENEKIVFINADAKLSLGITKDTVLDISGEKYEARYVVKRDVGGTINFNQVSKKIYLSRGQHNEDIFQTKGNLVRRNIFLKVDPTEDLETERTELRDEFTALKGEVTPPRIRTHEESRGQVGRVLGNISNYLSLISIIALFLSGVGTFYLFRSYILDKVKEIAILESLGLTKNFLYFINLFELIVVATISIGLSFIVSYLLFPLIPYVFGTLLPTDLIVSFNLASVSFVILIAFMAIIFFCLPLLYTLKYIKPIFLINESADLAEVNQFNFYLTFLPSCFSFYFLSVYLSESFFVGTIFSLAFIGIILLVILCQTLVLGFFSRFKDRFPLFINLIVKQFSHNKKAVSFYFFSIAISVVLIAIPPQVQNSLKEEIKRPANLTLPSLFLFNIQDFEEPGLVDLVKKDGYTLENISPMIFAQITHYNGKELKKDITDDSNDNPNDRARRSFQRSANLSYKKTLSESEKIVKGKDFSQLDKVNPGDVVELSVEEGYAQENGFNIGDTIEFRLTNIPYTFVGKVINLREVRWNSFQPNFFILVHPKALNDVPKQVVASIAGVSDGGKLTLKNSITDSFPSVSIVDVKETIDVIFSIVDKMNLLIRSMVIFCLILGFLILLSIVNYEVKRQEKEINLLKIISNGFWNVNKMVISQYLILGFFSTLVGLANSFVISYFFVKYVFNINYFWSWQIFLTLTVAMVLITFFITYLGASRVLNRKPILLLKSI